MKNFLNILKYELRREIPGILITLACISFFSTIYHETTIELATVVLFTTVIYIFFGELSQLELSTVVSLPISKKLLFLAKLIKGILAGLIISMGVALIYRYYYLTGAIEFISYSDDIKSYFSWYFTFFSISIFIRELIISVKLRNKFLMIIITLIIFALPMSFDMIAINFGFNVYTVYYIRTIVLPVLSILVAFLLFQKRKENLNIKTGILKFNLIKN